MDKETRKKGLSVTQITVVTLLVILAVLIVGTILVDAVSGNWVMPDILLMHYGGGRITYG